jgi:hypothetical protein
MVRLIMNFLEGRKTMKKYSIFGLLIVFALGASAGAIGCSKLQNTALSDPTALTQGLNTSSLTQQASTIPTTSVLPAAGDIDDAWTNEEQVTKDFQSDILTMFKAWKAGNIEEFKRIAELGIGGSVLANKVSEAEEWIIEGQGADVNNINYTKVKVTKLEGSAATVESEYSYSGYDYNVVTGARGQKFDPVVINRTYELEKKDNRWIIVKELEN